MERGVTVTSTMPSKVVGTATTEVPVCQVEPTKTASDKTSASPTATIGSSAESPAAASSS